MDSIFKAMRTYRTLPSLMVILVSTAFANVISKEIIILGLCCVLVYSAAGIHNAIKDNDYSLPQYTKKVIFALLFAAIIISLSNKIIFFAVMVGLILGLIYNTAARFILLGDATILAITHYALPSFSASLLLNLDLKSSFILAGLMFMTSWFIMHSKNLKDTIDDRKRSYRTLMTRVNQGKSLTIILFGLSFAPMLFAYFLFGLTKIYLLVLIFVFILGLLIIWNILKNKEEAALKLSRAMILLFLFGLIAGKVADIRIVLSAMFLCFAYWLFLISSKTVIPYATKQD